MPEAFDKVRAMGVPASHPRELLAVGMARRPSDVEGFLPIADQVLRPFATLRDLQNLSAGELRAQGLDEFESLRTLALLELGRRTAGSGGGEVVQIDCPQDVFRLLSHLRNEKQEHFIAVLLDAKNRVIRWTTVHIGTLTMSVVGTREVFRHAVREGASALIVAHNHPSGDPEPSPEDIKVTKHLAEAGNLLEIPLLDHIILGDRRWVSLSERKHV
ncbi:DNA repair protein RadC [bacterium]|nr:MAG: DNA repair protein RadC [bacterium]